MRDYKAIWEKWQTLLSQNIKFRNEILTSLHIEVSKGFDVIVTVASEQLGLELKNTVNTTDLGSKIESHLAFLAFGGYMLFLISEGVDPIEKNLIARHETNELGNVWTKNQEKDNGISLIQKVDPIMAIFLEKAIDEYINDLLVEFPSLPNASYKDVGKISNTFNWVSHQGFILGIIENELTNNTSSI